MEEAILMNKIFMNVLKVWILERIQMLKSQSYETGDLCEDPLLL